MTKNVASQNDMALHNLLVMSDFVAYCATPLISKLNYSFGGCFRLILARQD